jgi:hypothetical protein
MVGNKGFDPLNFAKRNDLLLQVGNTLCLSKDEGYHILGQAFCT